MVIVGGVVAVWVVAVVPVAVDAVVLISIVDSRSEPIARLRLNRRDFEFSWTSFEIT